MKKSVLDQASLDTTRYLSRQIVALSLVISFIVTIILDGGWVGVGAYLRSIVFVSGFAYIKFKSKKPVSAYVWVLLGSSIILSLFQVIRTSEALTVMNSLMSLQLLLIAALELTHKPPIKLFDYIFRSFFMLLTALPSFGETVAAMKLAPPKKNSEKTTKVLRGILFSLPLVLIFGALFASADAVFADLIDTVFFDIRNPFSAQTTQYLITGLLLFMLSAAFLGAIFITARKKIAAKSLIDPSKDWSLELRIMLGSLNALFILFLVIQAVYLFGDTDTVINGDLTYAEYGRQGFFELLTVATGVFVIAYNILPLVVKPSARAPKALLVLLIAQVGVVMVSAIRRLGLYEDVFGFTELRFYSHSFIFYLMAIFVLLLVYIHKNGRGLDILKWITLTSVSYLVCLNLVNPDAFIAQQNIDRYVSTGKFDEVYFSRLSSDATAQKIQALSVLDADTAQDIRSTLCMWELDLYSNQYDSWRVKRVGASTAKADITNNCRLCVSQIVLQTIGPVR